MGRSAETGKEEVLYYGLLAVLKDRTDETRAQSTLAAIVAGAHEARFALPGLQPACKPRRHCGSGPAMLADLEGAGTRARWIRAASAELPCGADACGRRVDRVPAVPAEKGRRANIHE